MDDTFVNWLISEKMGRASALDVAYRLKRVNAIKPLNLKTPDHKYLYELYLDEKFLKLSMSVKSQLKRAVNLYYEFAKMESALSQ